MPDIDFVVPWVDGNDPVWREKKNHWTGKDTMVSVDVDGDCRYRDWDNFRFWFRSVEQNAPWVHRIYLITDQQVPAWLNTKHPKLCVVDHKDYIPEKYLPTFSSHTIEMNIHRIGGLSEYIVYFNDDMFINKPVKEEDFFQKGLPCLFYSARNMFFQGTDVFAHILYNNMAVINRNFSLKKNRNIRKLLSPRYGKKVFGNLKYLFLNSYVGFHIEHLCSPLRKSTLEEIWEKEAEELDHTCSHKLRDATDVNQMLILFWAMAQGSFIPAGRHGKAYNINEKNVRSCAADIVKAKSQVICVNDHEKVDNWNLVRDEILKAFEKRYPHKSSFEL